MLKNLLLLSLPSLCIYYSLSNPAGKARYLYAERFGDRDHYLDLYFPSHPLGPLRGIAGENRFHFDGHLVHEKGQERVRGVRYEKRGVSFYEFSSSQGAFHGVLVKSQKGCEPEMQYQVVRSGGNPSEKGTLHAGFCP